jgi:hypothetical protein
VDEGYGASYIAREYLELGPGLVVPAHWKKYDVWWEGGGGRMIASSKPAQAKLPRFYPLNKIKTKGLEA